MSAYQIIKLLIKYKRKTRKELLAYCDAYLATGKISEKQYEELVALIG